MIPFINLYFSFLLFWQRGTAGDNRFGRIPHELREDPLMAEQLANNLWRLEIPLVGNPLKALNSYLITGERNLLIDTGFNEETCRKAMVEELELSAWTLRGRISF